MGFGELGENGEGIKQYDLVVTEQSPRCRSRREHGNTVNNILITMHGATWTHEAVGEHSVKY